MDETYYRLKLNAKEYNWFTFFRGHMSDEDACCVAQYHTSMFNKCDKIWVDPKDGRVDFVNVQSDTFYQCDLTDLLNKELE